jgi:hypothetical protein
MLYLYRCYYLSAENYEHDTFLHTLMDDDWSVAIAELIKFPRLRLLRLTVDDVTKYLSSCLHLQILPNERVRIR